MFPLSRMDCNGKSLLQWDWEDLIMLNEAGSHGKPQPARLEFEKHGGIVSLAPNFSGLYGSVTDATFDMGHVGLSKSSQTTSISSSYMGVKTSELTLETREPISRKSSSKNNFTKTKAAGSSPTLEASVFSAEPFLSLKLGKRTYFEDTSAGNNDFGSSVSVDFGSSTNPEKRSKCNSPDLQAPRCQVEGCNLDLSSAKDYHRKHRVCETHSKCPKVIIGGLERRFCQQCSRFHGLSEFDEKKRSCRKRLSDHNARRRKQQPEAFRLNAPTIYERKQRTDLDSNRFSLIPSRAEEKFAWDGMFGSKPSYSLGFTLNPPKVEGVDWRLLLDGNDMPNSIPTHHGTSAYLPLKARISGIQIPSRDAPEFPMSFSFDGAHDFHSCSLSSVNSFTGLMSSETDNCIPENGVDVQTQQLYPAKSASIRQKPFKVK